MFPSGGSPRRPGAEGSVHAARTDAAQIPDDHDEGEEADREADAQGQGTHHPLRMLRSGGHMEHRLAEAEDNGAEQNQDERLDRFHVISPRARLLPPHARAGWSTPPMPSQRPAWPPSRPSAAPVRRPGDKPRTVRGPLRSVWTPAVSALQFSWLAVYGRRRMPDRRRSGLAEAVQMDGCRAPIVKEYAARSGGSRWPDPHYPRIRPKPPHRRCVRRRTPGTDAIRKRFRWPIRKIAAGATAPNFSTDAARSWRS